MMNDIEIGISIDAKVYLHIEGNNLTTPFEVPKIINVTEQNGLTVLTYMQSTPDDCVNLIVTEKPDDIAEAMNNAIYYKNEALQRINELLESK